MLHTISRHCLYRARKVLLQARSMCAARRYDDDFFDDPSHYLGDYDDVHTDHGWEVDSFFRPPRVAEQGHVWLDPHILANPAIADIDGDGQEELVLAVSYFFDRDQYSRPVSYLLEEQLAGSICCMLCSTRWPISAVASYHPCGIIAGTIFAVSSPESLTAVDYDICQQQSCRRQHLCSNACYLPCEVK